MTDVDASRLNQGDSGQYDGMADLNNVSDYDVDIPPSSNLSDYDVDMSPVDNLSDYDVDIPQVANLGDYDVDIPQATNLADYDVDIPQVANLGDYDVDMPSNGILGSPTNNANVVYNNAQAVSTPSFVPTSSQIASPLPLDEDGDGILDNVQSGIGEDESGSNGSSSNNVMVAVAASTTNNSSNDEKADDSASTINSTVGQNTDMSDSDNKEKNKSGESDQNNDVPAGSYDNYKILPDASWPPPMYIKRNIPPDERFYMEHRWHSEWSFFDKKATENKNLYHRYQWIIGVGSVAVPVLVGINPADATATQILYFLTVGISLAVAISAAIENIYKYGENWRSYRQAAEELKQEKSLYDARAGRYSERNGAFARFAEKVEEIIAQQNGRWVQTTEKQQAQAAEETQDILDNYRDDNANSSAGLAEYGSQYATNRDAARAVAPAPAQPIAVPAVAAVAATPVVESVAPVVVDVVAPVAEVATPVVDTVAPVIDTVASIGGDMGVDVPSIEPMVDYTTDMGADVVNYDGTVTDPNATTDYSDIG